MIPSLVHGIRLEPCLESLPTYLTLTYFVTLQRQPRIFLSSTPRLDSVIIDDTVQDSWVPCKDSIVSLRQAA